MNEVHFIVFLAFTFTAHSAPAYLNIKIHNPVSDTLTLLGYHSPCDVIQGKVQLASLESETGEFQFIVELKTGTEFNLLNGDRLVAFDLFLSPGDSLRLEYSEGAVSISGRGEDRIDFIMAFNDTFYRVMGKEHANSYKLDSAAFLTRLENRYAAQVKYLDAYLRTHTEDVLFEKYMRATINYKYGIDRYQYLWKHNYLSGRKGSFRPGSDYFRPDPRIPLDNPVAAMSPNYYWFLKTTFQPFGMTNTKPWIPRQNRNFFHSNTVQSFRSLTACGPGVTKTLPGPYIYTPCWINSD